MADKIVSWGGFDSKGTSGMGVTGSLAVIFTTTTTVHGEGNTLLQLRGINGSSPGSNDGRLHIGYNQNDPELRLNSGGISVSTGKWTFLPQIWFPGGITSTHNTAFTLDGMTNGVTSGTAGDIIKFTQRNGQFASFYDAGNGLSEFRVWQQANSNNYIYLKPGQTSIFNLSPVTIKGSGATSSTTAFQVQNSNASASFTVKDDRSATFAKEIYVDGDLGDGTGGSIYLKNSAGDYLNRIGTSGYDTFISTRGTANGIFFLFGIGSGRTLNFQGGGSGNISISTANASLSINSVNDIVHGSDLIKIESRNYNGGEGVVIVRGRSTSLTDPIVTFKYDTVEKVRITNSGNVGIGISTPTASLHISGSSNSVLLEIDSPAANNIIFVSGSGNVGIGTGTPTATLHVSGSGRFTNGLTVSGSVNMTGSYLLRGGNGSFVSSFNYTSSAYDSPTFYNFNDQYNFANSGNNSTVKFYNFTPSIINTIGGFADSGRTDNNILGVAATYTATGNDSFQYQNQIRIAPSVTNYRYFNARAIYFAPTLTSISVLDFRFLENTTGDSYFNTTSGVVNIGSTTGLGARLGVKGSGTTSSTTALTVQNASGTSSFSVQDGVSVSGFLATAGNWTDSTFYRDTLWRPATLASARDITVGSDGTLNGYSSRLNFVNYYSNGGQGNQSNFAGYIRTSIGQYIATGGGGGNQNSGRGTLLLGVYDSDYSSTVLNSFDVISVGKYATSISGSVTVSSVLTLTPQSPLPSGVPTGSFAVSSSVPPKPYFYDGTAWNALY